MRNEWSVDPQELQAMESHTELPSGTAELVVKAVEALPKQLREMANALWWERLSHPATARLLGLAPATYWRRHAAMKAALAEKLKDLA